MGVIPVCTFLVPTGMLVYKMSVGSTSLCMKLYVA